MAKLPASALGVDIGRHTIKAVFLKRQGANRLSLTQFAVQELPQAPLDLESLISNLKAILAEMGLKGARACGICLSGSDSFVRTVEQQTMPPELLRMALRLNGISLLNQDCRDLVVDCDNLLPQKAGGETTDAGRKSMSPYVVGGMPRAKVMMIHEACTKAKLPATKLQLGPVALFNAFESSNPETFMTQGFLLVDIGNVSSTVVVGVKKELILVRVLEFGSSNFVEELICHGASNYAEILEELSKEEVLTVENARLALSELVRSISSSIGFFEARREEAISRVYVSGGMAKSETILKILTEELQLPCEVWNPFQNCQIELPASKREALTQEWASLNIAYGVAAEILTNKA